MKPFKYSIIGIIDGQEFTSSNNTFEELKKLFDMIRGLGGYVLEYTAEEV